MMRRSLTGDGAETLGRMPLFADLSPAERRMLARLVDELTAQAGETVMSQGEPGYEVLVIEEGGADVVQDGVRINTMRAGDFFGELAVLDETQRGGLRSASVIATSELRAIVLTAHFLHEVRERMPLIRERIDQVAAQRIEHDANAHPDA